MWRIKRSDELYHHGIIGQKWGIHRYQNPDGSLTEEGLIRYRKDASDAKNKAHDAYYEKTEDLNPKKYSYDDYDNLKSGKYKDLADTIDRETAESRKVAEEATKRYMDTGKHFIETKRTKAERQKAWDNNKQANADYWDEFFSISEQYIQEHFTKEQWDDARAFVYDHSKLWW